MTDRRSSRGVLTQERVLKVAGELFCEKGYEGVGLQEILTSADISKGSLYFHFPGGKEQLALESMAQSAEKFKSIFRIAVDSENPLPFTGVLHAIFDGLRLHLQTHQFRSACPITALAHCVSVEAIRENAVCLYKEWEREIGILLDSYGVIAPSPIAILAAVEGALLLAQSYRSLIPLDHAESMILLAMKSKRSFDEAFQQR